MLLVNVFFLLITLALLYFSHIQHKRQKRLEQEEMETRRRQEELDQLNRELQAPMNEISELIYISDPETYDLLFINESGRKAFGCDSIEGKKCYKVLQGLDHPCPFCTNSRLKDNETDVYKRQDCRCWPLSYCAARSFRYPRGIPVSH